MTSLIISKTILLVASLLGHLTVGNSTTNEETHEKCIKDANRKFASLAQSIYQSGIFDGAINNLKCIYLDLVDGKIDDTIPCETKRVTSLHLDHEKLVKIKDFNKKEDVALQRYVQLLSDCIKNLADVEIFESNATYRKSFVKLVKKVKRKLKKIKKRMKFITKIYRRCNQEIFNSRLRTIPERVILPFNEPRLINAGFKREELAGAVFKQIQTVFHQIRVDISHRLKCIF